MKTHLSLVLCFFLAICSADTLYPLNSSWDKPSTEVSPLAERGGTLRRYLGPSPKSLNAYLDNSVTSNQVFSLLYESLIGMDESLQYDRQLAYKWTISDDKKTFTFWLDPNARWSDGTPITAEDVKWTIDALRDPKNMTGAYKLPLEEFASFDIVENGAAIRCVAKNVHWRNLTTIGGLSILPKHAFANQDFNKINFSFPVVSGPYKIKEFKEGNYLLLERRNDWWRDKWVSTQHSLNFDTLKYVFYEDQNNAFDALLKDEFDVMEIYTARFWEKIELNRETVRKNWIVKQAVYNQAPVGFQGLAMNMRKPPFDDLRVRRAMAHLIDRKMIVATMMFNQYFLQRSYWEDLYDAKHPCDNATYDFDVAKACALLDDAGWKINPATGKREKNGKPFVFSFLQRSDGAEKVLTFYKSQLERVGIEMNIVSKDWSSWVKDMDSFMFDMTWAAWGAGLFKDPEHMWSSTSANQEGGNNITGFANPEVDKLIDSQKQNFNIEERNDICRKIDKILCDACPYVLLWNLNYTRLLYWNRFGTPDSVLGRYSSGAGDSLWWADEDAEAFLQDAMENNQPLPKRPAEIHVK